MSDNIHLDIQVEVLKRLPVRSLLQFRSVSKTWKSLIDSSGFVADYSRQHTQMQHIFIRYLDITVRKHIYVSIVDDDTFSGLRVSLPPPLLAKEREYYSIMGYSHGLFCFYCPYQVGGPTGIGRAVVWNPSIRKTVDVAVPNVANEEIYNTVVGFGVCPKTNDPKIVKIESASCIPWKVEVFTLSTLAWRSLGGNLPHKLVHFEFDWSHNCDSVDIDGVLYWLATDTVSVDGELTLLISFDITSEEFGEVNLPNRLAHCQPGPWLDMLKLRESLVVLDNDPNFNGLKYDVWVMEGGVTKSFSKLLTVNLNTLRYARVMGFRKSGEHIIEVIEDKRRHLVVYEPHSKRIDNLGIDGVCFTYCAHLYMETLSLLDHHDELETQIKGTEDRTMGSTSGGDSFLGLESSGSNSGLEPA